VEATIGEADTGVWRHDYSQQPTFGFYSVMYLAETQICRPLWDPQGVLEGLKARVAVYPPVLKARVVADGLWSTEFTLRHAEVYAARGDVYNTAGCLARCATNLTQALFGLNEVYFLSDKRALRQIEGFAQKPQGYGARLCAVLACPGRSAEELTASVGEVKTLWGEACGLAVEIYRGSEW
jgi:hypothetical protein